MAVTEEQFWAVMTSQRDEALAALTSLIDMNGMDEMCDFVAQNVMPNIVREPETLDDKVRHVVCFMAMVGAVDAFLAWRDREAD